MDVPVKDPPSLQYLRENGCLVRILHVHNPHIIFVKKPGNNRRYPKHICQIGLRGIFPTDENGDKSADNRRKIWTDKTKKKMLELINEAKELYFVSAYADELHELFNGICCTLGNLYLLNMHDEVEDLSTLLCANKCAHFCYSTFKKLLSEGCIYEKPSFDELEMMKTLLMPHILKQLKFNETLNSTGESKKLEILQYRVQPKRSIVNQQNSVFVHSKQNTSINVNKRSNIRIRDLINSESTAKNQHLSISSDVLQSDSNNDKATKSNQNTDKIFKLNRCNRRDLINSESTAKNQHLSISSDVLQSDSNNDKATKSNQNIDKILKLNRYNRRNLQKSVDVTNNLVDENDLNKNMKSEKINKTVDHLNTNYYSKLTDSTKKTNEQKIEYDHHHTVLNNVLDDFLNDETNNIDMNESITDMSAPSGNDASEVDPELSTSDTEDNLCELSSTYLKITLPKLTLSPKSKLIEFNPYHQKKPNTFNKINKIDDNQNAFKCEGLSFTLDEIDNHSKSRSIFESMEYENSNLNDNIISVDSTKITKCDIPDKNLENSFSKVLKIEECYVDEKVEQKQHLLPYVPKSSDNISNFIDGICKPKLMVCSKYGKPPDFWLDLSKAFFSKPILNSLSVLKIKTPTWSQKIIWPSVMRGRNTLLVGPRNSGKTLGFLLPLCNLISETNFEELPSTYGPVVWIICPTLTTAIFVEKTCRTLVCDISGISVLRIDNSVDEGTNISSILEGCTILISTPVLLKFITSNPILNLKRLLYLMFCDADVLNDKFYSEISKIFGICMNHSPNQIQILADSRKWCDFLSGLAYSIPNPLLTINAFQEGLLCSKFNMKALFVNSSNKQKELNDYLNHLEKKKIIIICESDDEISRTANNVDSSKHEVIEVFDHMGLDKYIEIAKRWEYVANTSSPVILIACDSGLVNLNITNADCLIHFFIPSLFTTFQSRYSLIIDNLTPTWIEKDNPPPHVVVFISETNMIQLPKLVNFLNRCGVEIDADVMEMSKSLIHLRDSQKAESSIELCEELLSYGFCSDVWNCNFRHSIVPKYDKPKDWLPRSGYVNFEIVHVYNVCHYSARLISYIKTDGTKVEMMQNYCDLAVKMCKFFYEEQNKIPIRTMTPGNICVAEIKKNQFFRCKIIKVLTEETLKMKSNVLINLIDQNMTIVCNANCIFELPKEFQGVENPIVQIRLVGIKPKDKDVAWSLIETKKMKHFFFEICKNMFMRGKIDLGLNDTLWMDSIQCVQAVNSRDKVAVRTKLKNHILDNYIGIMNSEHLPLLYDLCERNSIDLPNCDLSIKRKSPKSEEEKLSKPQWAFIESDKFSDIYFSSGIDPHKFFIRIAKWESCLLSLEKDIEKYVSNLTENNLELNTSNRRVKSFDIGNYYLAKNLDGKFYRCRIDKIDSVESSFKYTCFFVDYGDSACVDKNNILPLLPKFITQLPFQAIECKLVGIEPFSDEWNKSAIDFLFEYCFDSENCDIMKILCAKEVYNEAANLTGGKKSAVFIFDPFSETNESFNDLFILKSFAKILRADAHYLNESIEDMEKYLAKFSKQVDKSIEDDNDHGECSPDGSGNMNSFEMVEDQSDFDCNSVFKDFESDNDSCSSDEDWDCTLTMEDLKRIKNMSEANIVEVPNNATSSNIDEYFDSNKQTEKIPSINRIVESTDNEKINISVNIREIPSHKTPFVRWTQTDGEIFMKIDLVGVYTYVMIIKEDSLIFECAHKDIQYKLDIELFGCVDKDECSHTCYGLYILVKLVKAWKKNWPSLLKSTRKLPWLRYECNIDSSDSEEEENKNNKKAAKEEILDILTKADLEGNSDDEEDDEEIPELADVVNTQT